MTSACEPHAKKAQSKSTKKRLSMQVEGALYTYKALVLRCIDGDTIVAEIDLGLRMSSSQTLRLIGIDTAELRSHDPRTRELANAGAKRTAELVQGKRVIIRTTKSDSFGRYLAQVWLEDGTDVNQTLVDEGYAQPWKG